MKVNLSLKIVSLIALLQSVLLPASYASTKTITIAADEWCPINCNPLDDKPGFMVEVAKKVFAKHDIQVIYQKMPWSRALLMVRQGNIHGAIGAYVEDAPDFIFPEHEQAMVNFSFYAKENLQWQYTDITSLNHVRLAVIKDYSYLALIDGYIQQNKDKPKKVVVSYGDDPLKANLKLLFANRVDVILANDYVIKHLINTNKISNTLKVVGQPTAASKAFIAFSPALTESKKLTQILSDGMVELRKSGELRDILARYHLSDWK